MIENVLLTTAVHECHALERETQILRDQAEAMRYERDAARSGCRRLREELDRLRARLRDLTGDGDDQPEREATAPENGSTTGQPGGKAQQAHCRGAGATPSPFNGRKPTHEDELAAAAMGGLATAIMAGALAR